MHLLSQIIYSCKTLYMLLTVVPSIIRSSKLHIQQQAYVKQLLLPAAIGDEMERSSISSPIAVHYITLQYITLRYSVWPVHEEIQGGNFEIERLAE
jgi:hypothetical protein